MTKAKHDSEREERITMEIIVDCYDESERAMGWYYYLQDKLQFPFTAQCIAKRPVSPLRVNDEVEVIGMAPEEECECEMFVLIRWEKEELAVPLAQLKPVAADEETVQAAEDWHYWIQQGYQF
jgi:calcium binding protein